jgi:ubiquitin C-terminal hydrolase
MFLQNILKLSPQKLVNHLINKIDIYDLFLIKCILRKCNKNPLDTKKMLCTSNISKEAMFNLILFILRNISEEKKDLTINIWNELDNHHKLGFWKTKNHSDWKLEAKDIDQNKYIGLKNMTFTCYMNSIIQQFFMIPMFRETILSIENKSNDTVLYQLQLLFSALKTYEYKYYNPKPFVIRSGLNFYEQMDADEYFGQFIDRIENDIKSLYKENEDCPYKELFKFFFGIKVLDELKFVDCGHKRYNEFYYNNIQLEIKGCTNIEESLKKFCKIEIMDGDNKINCEVCNIKRTCHKRQIFKSLPNILIIALKRFEFDYDSMIKIKLNDYFEFPFELNMKDYLIEENTEVNTMFELTGITIHDGVADFGHYYDLIKGPDEKWYEFNDTSVKEFKKESIPDEAFGDKNCEDEINKDEQSEGEKKNNAYILIYTKKNFNKEKIENLENNFKTKLALPPYSKFSNINEKNKSIVNCHMFKYWTLQNITCPYYQGFIINLLKIDLVKNYDKTIEMNHPELFKELREEEYITNSNKKEEKKDKNINKDENNDKKDNKIFEYGLRYYFNVMLRTNTREREYMSKYDEIIKVYIESDTEKAQYILEEFSDNDALNEYLVFCPEEEDIKYCISIIITAFKKYYNDKNIKDKILLFKFINCLLLFIYYNIENINLEYIITLLNQLIYINKDKVFIKYLKEKNIEMWILTVVKDEEMTEEDETNNDLIMSEDNLPLLKSKHFILTEKTKLEEGTTETNDDRRDSDSETANEKRLKEININYKLIRKLGFELHKEK